LFEFHCHGIARPQVIAAHLKLSLATIKNLKKRLKHNWIAVSGAKSPADTGAPWKFFLPQRTHLKLLTTAPKKFFPLGGAISFFDSLYSRGT
jgi:hypothetical protein